MRIRPETLPVGALTCGLTAAAFAVPSEVERP